MFSVTYAPFAHTCSHIGEVLGQHTTQGTMSGHGIQPLRRFPFTTVSLKASLSHLRCGYADRQTANFDFGAGGRRHTAHPILVLPVKLASPPSPDLPAELAPPAGAAKKPAVAAPAPESPPQGNPRELGRIGRFQVRLWPGQRGLLDATFGSRRGRAAFTSAASRRACWETRWTLPIPAAACARAGAAPLGMPAANGPCSGTRCRTSLRGSDQTGGEEPRIHAA